MRSRARIVVEADRDGTSRVVEMAESAPLGMHMTRDALYLVGTAQGLVGDDDLGLEVIIGRGATLRVRSVAATIAYASSEARLHISCVVGEGGHLDWHLEPVIATSRCHARLSSAIALANGATLRWSEDLLLGRFGEEPGDLDLVCTVDYDDRPLLRHQLLVGSGTPGWDGPAGIAGHRAIGYSAIVGDELGGGARQGEGWAVLDLDGPGCVITAVAVDLIELRQRSSLAHRSLAGPAALAGVR